MIHLGEPLTERHVQALWYDRDLRPARLVTRRGEAVEVVHPGEWNLGPGPDFRNAVLAFGDGRRVRGDVEVHLSPGDWESHGHGGNPAYARVVAHVTWLGGPVPPSLPPEAVSIWLGRFFASDPGFAPDQIDLGAYPFARLPLSDRPCAACFARDRDLALRVLAESGAQRLALKASRLARLGVRPGAVGAARAQLFYAEVMNALGYRQSSPMFRAVAAAVPLAEVLAEPENAAAAFRVAAMFADVDGPCAGMRPRNRPAVRLEAAAALLTETDALELADATDFSPKGCRRMLSVLTSGGHIGRGRAAAILANVVVPFALAEGRLARPPDWLPPEDISYPVRLTAFRLFGRDHNPAAWYATNGCAIQGLLQIYRAFCLQVHPDCAGCRLAACLHELRAMAAMN